MSSAIQNGHINVVLLFCGSFNPITISHLRIIELAKNRLARDNLRVISCIISPVNQGYGKRGLSSPKHRIEMCRLASESSNGLVKVDSWEADRDEWTPTRHVFDHFKELLDDQSDPLRLGHYGNLKLVGLCGLDMLASYNIPNLWKSEDIERLVYHYGMAVADRSGCSMDDIINANSILRDDRANLFLFEDFVSNNISSTCIRKAVREGLPIDYLVPNSVRNYIFENFLYKK